MHQGSDPKVNRDAEKKALLYSIVYRGHYQPGVSMFSQKILKIRCSGLVKNAFAIQVIQYLLHYSIVYTFTHYLVIKMPDALIIIIAFLRSYLHAVQVTFFLLVRILLLLLLLLLLIIIII